MTKAQWLEIINRRQDFYVEQLKEMLVGQGFRKHIYFNSPTGTGKTVMIAKLMAILQSSDFFFIVTTLSRGGLSKQVSSSLERLSKADNFVVFGVSSFTKSTKLQGNDIERAVPTGKKLVWIRDEGHIKSNKWTDLLEEKAFKIIHVSATNSQVDIQCNFTDTPLLRTPIQRYGSPSEAVEKLLEIKRIHQNVPDYNPCLIVRDVSGELAEEFSNLCARYGLKSINITDNDTNIQELCKNDNPYEVIINKMKITEGIDIPRANVIYIGNRPSNEATIIQLIGRVRRNALLWHKKIDIFDEKNARLLHETTKTYIYYRVSDMSVQTTDGELCMELSDTISLESLLADEVTVFENRLENGYKIAELDLLSEPYSGVLKLSHNEDFVKITNIRKIYTTKTETIREFNTEFKAIVKDEEMVKVSFDKCKFYRLEEKGVWRTANTVSDNILYGKLPKFIKEKYKKELSEIPEKSFGAQKIIFDFEKSDGLRQKLYSGISFFAEYYLKYLLYGERYFEPFLTIAKNQFLQSKSQEYSDSDIVLLAAAFCHKKHISLFYGNLIERLVPNFTAEDIVSMPQNVKAGIILMAKKAYSTLDSILQIPKDQSALIPSPHVGNRKILHGVAGIVTQNKIVQLSYNGKITEETVFKVLAYHFLSTKRYDLSIDEAIVYDFKSAACLRIAIDDKNRSTLPFFPAVPLQNECNEEIRRKFNPLHLLAFYRQYGKEMTVDAINKTEKEFAQAKKNFGKESAKVRKQFLSSAWETQEEEIVRAALSVLKPSKDTLRSAIRLQDVSLVEKQISAVKPDAVSFSAAIKIQNVAILNLLLSKSLPDISHLREAMDEQNIEISNILAEIVPVTKYNANDVIRTKNVVAIKRLLKKITPSKYNLQCAIQTNDETVIEMVQAKAKKR